MQLPERHNGGRGVEVLGDRRVPAGGGVGQCAAIDHRRHQEGGLALEQLDHYLGDTRAARGKAAIAGTSLETPSRSNISRQVNAGSVVPRSVSSTVSGGRKPRSAVPCT